MHRTADMRTEACGRKSDSASIRDAYICAGQLILALWESFLTLLNGIHRLNYEGQFV